MRFPHAPAALVVRARALLPAAALAVPAVLLAPALLTATPAQAQTANAADVAARATVQRLYDGLLSIMRNAGQLGFQGRFNRIAPIIDQTFDVALVTRLVVGPGWNALSAADKRDVATAFRRMTVSQVAGSFNGYNGQKFIIDPKIEARGTDRLVKTQLITASRPKPIMLAYRLRQIGGQWRIIDVFYENSISQVATKRSDFSRIFATGGAPALIAHLNQLSERAAK